MESVLTGAIRDVVAAVEPERTPVQRRMEARADETGFPVIGPAAGGLLSLLTRSIEARRVFEFGSGFGYSATWFAEAVTADGEVVLTEHDRDQLERAREYFEATGLADRAAFEHGDAFEVLDRYDGPFDVVLVDCEKHRYPDAIDPVEAKLAPGGLLVADNALTAAYTPEELATGFAGEPPAAVADDVTGIVEYLTRLADDPAYDTSVIPLGEGLAISHFRGRP